MGAGVRHAVPVAAGVGAGVGEPVPVARGRRAHVLAGVGHAVPLAGVGAVGSAAPATVLAGVIGAPTATTAGLGVPADRLVAPVY